MYRVAFHLVSILLLLLLLAPLAQTAPRANFTERPVRAGRLLERAGPELCREYGLSRKQIALCRSSPDEVAVALEGLEMAIAECQHQFQWHRWNCSLGTLNNKNPHRASLLRKGYPESAFAYAISAAGVMQAVSRSCGLGELKSCSCGHEEPPHDNNAIAAPGDLYEQKMERTRRQERRKRWKEEGCHHNLQYGKWFSEQFLDVLDDPGDLQSNVNLHNNNAGRLTVLANVVSRCKCHGVSGSCAMQTCWRSTPEFRRVGEALKNQTRSAILVQQANRGRSGHTNYLEHAEEMDNKVHEILPEVRMNSRGGRRANRKSKRRRRGYFSRQLDSRDLLYFQKPPNYCEKSKDYPGTVGRRCNLNSSGVDGCGLLCCQRGYDWTRVPNARKCPCQFQWCCQVKCGNCTVHDEWQAVCK